MVIYAPPPPHLKKGDIIVHLSVDLLTKSSLNIEQTF